MQKNDTKKISFSEIGYHGAPIDALNRGELLEAFPEMAQTVVNCTSTKNQCKAIFTENQDQQEV
ncbi:MAG: hypothetical protein KJO26_15360 [Deltaproteobacteria bacterium]|nr:hypothetical protein [Deltaproteobacteria bacterium]